MCYYLTMTGKKETPFIYFEAKPKHGNDKIVNEKIAEIVGLFAEIFDKHRRNCNLHPEQRGNMWTVLITFESEEAKRLLDQDPRFQEAMTDLRVYCRRAYRIRRMLYPILHPGKRFGGILYSPVSFPD